MSDPSRSEELIQKYLDDIATAEEIEELDRLIREEPAAAAAFNAMARLDGALCNLSSEVEVEFNGVFIPPPAQQPTGHKRPRWIRDRRFWVPAAAAAYALVMIVALRFLVIRPDHTPQTIDVTIADADDLDLERFERELDYLEVLELIAKRSRDPEEHVSVEETEELLKKALEVHEVEHIEVADLYARAEQMDISLATAKTRTLPPQIDASVKQALDWLKKHQQPNGSWAAPVSTENIESAELAVTSLALLAFVEHGETTSSVEYGDSVRSALLYLLSRQSENTDPRGAYGRLEESGLLAHALAAYAIGRAYTSMRVPSLRQSVEWAAACMTADPSTWTQHMSEETAWASPPIESTPEDVWNSGAYVLSDPALDPELREHSMQLVALGLSDDMARADYVQQANDHIYHLSQAVFEQGGPKWTRWNSKFTRAYLRNQNDDGSWSSPYPGSTGPDAQAEQYGKAFSTALGALLLQTGE